jgi:hypothetical protein
LIKNKKSKVLIQTLLFNLSLYEISFIFFFLADFHQKNPIMAANKYGITKRYKMPVFKPAPMLVSPLLTLFSTEALHMAHCPNEETLAKKNETKINKKRKNLLISTVL